MKHLKVPTKKQKILMRLRGLDFKNWMVERDTPECMAIVHRTSNRRRNIHKVVD